MSFDVLSCSWPRPIKEADRIWLSEPEWNAPRMADYPKAEISTMDGKPCLILNWREIFRRTLSSFSHAEMRGFHLVFTIRVHDSGKMVFWDDDGSVIRRNGQIIHEDRQCHPLSRHELSVTAGDRLEIAHWQCYGDWVWAGRLESEKNGDATIDVFRAYLPQVSQTLLAPNGPPLKIYCAGASPARTVLCIYSMILNGYSPTVVYLYGEHQWHANTRKVFATLLPFARVVATSNLLQTVANYSSELANLAQFNWWVMKLCVGLLCEPDEYCLMDDDVFILGPVDDAVSEFQRSNLVYAQDVDYSELYRSVWPAEITSSSFPNGRINTGLYWLRNKHNHVDIAARLLAARHCRIDGWMWEQGFMAVEYAREPVTPLLTQRYFYPFCDGLPGGLTGYDYQTNPCGFVSVHFGGLLEKPSDQQSRMLAAEVLNIQRQRHPLR